jgi:serine/threonine protein phosphatase PrpC
LLARTGSLPCHATPAQPSKCNPHQHCSYGAEIILTKEHTTQDAAELARIKKAGGRVTLPSGPDDVVRVGESGLEVTRSIGDIADKPHGVSATPDILSCAIEADDLFIILASDGLWGKVSYASAVHSQTSHATCFPSHCACLNLCGVCNSDDSLW